MRAAAVNPGKYILSQGYELEIGIDIYTLPWVRQIAGGKLLYRTGS